jgi:hypothetical protein
MVTDHRLLPRTARLSFALAFHRGAARLNLPPAAAFGWGGAEAHPVQAAPTAGARELLQRLRDRFG